MSESETLFVTGLKRLAVGAALIGKFQIVIGSEYITGAVWVEHQIIGSQYLGVGSIVRNDVAHKLNGVLIFRKGGIHREIQTIITAEGLNFVEDASNALTKYARNKLRHEVVPVLKELNPNLEATFENNLRNFRELEVLLNDTVDRLKKKLLVHEGNEVYIDIEKVKQLSPKRLLLFKLLQDFGFIETVVDDLLTVLDKHAGRVFESPGFTLVVDRGRLIIGPKNENVNADVIINTGDNDVQFDAYKLKLLHDDSPLIIKNNPMAASVDADKLFYPLTVRAWKKGDSFYPLGMKTRQKLSDFFIHQKVPLHKKADVPVLVNGNGDIIWVGGYRPD
ncbi:MAG: hypothetical protein EOP10_16845, partial [Proteobacteria bacterium]